MTGFAPPLTDVFAPDEVRVGDTFRVAFRIRYDTDSVNTLIATHGNVVESASFGPLSAGWHSETITAPSEKGNLHPRGAGEAELRQAERGAAAEGRARTIRQGRGTARARPAVSLRGLKRSRSTKETGPGSRTVRAGPLPRISPHRQPAQGGDSLYDRQPNGLRRNPWSPGWPLTSSDGGRFTFMAFALLHLDSQAVGHLPYWWRRELRFVCAGHPVPIYVRAGSSRARAAPRINALKTSFATTARRTVASPPDRRGSLGRMTRPPRPPTS